MQLNGVNDMKMTVRKAINALYESLEEVRNKNLNDSQRKQAHEMANVSVPLVHEIVNGTNIAVRAGIAASKGYLEQSFVDEWIG